MDKRKIKKKLKSITVRILEDLLDISEDLASLALDRKAVYSSFQQNKNYEWPKTKVGRWLESLKQKGYLKSSEINGQKVIILTDKAKLRIVDKISSKAHTDGKFRFISFDIPEDLRTKRNQFRRAIKNMGFAQIQKSLWVIDRNITELVETAMREYGVEKYVAYIISERSDIDSFIAKRIEQQNKLLEKL